MTTMFVEAFGCLSPSMAIVSADDEDGLMALVSADGEPYYQDLYSTFLDRALLMGWDEERAYGKSVKERSNRLWGMEEAELTLDQAGSRIGFVQVGFDIGSGGSGTLDPSTPIWDASPHHAHPDADLGEIGSPPIDPAVLSTGTWAAYPMPDAPPPTPPTIGIPPLLQCVDDAIRWFGDTEISAYQLTGFELSPGQQSSVHELWGCLNWFRTGPSRPGTEAVVSMAADLWDERIASAVADEVCQMQSSPFEFEPLIAVADEHAARTTELRDEWADLDSQPGLRVAMPQWSASAVGWIIALLFGVVLGQDPAPANLAVRVTRLDI